MNERQLYSFIKTSEVKSFSKAAKEGYISTVALKQQIDLLESDLGFKLFERSNKGVTLTKAGEMFYQKAKEIIRIYEDSIEQGKQLNKRSIRIAYPFENCPSYLLKKCQSMFEKKNVRFSYVAAPYKDHFKDLRNNEIDLSIIAKPTAEYLGDDLAFVALSDDVYAFCMSDENRLSNKKKLCEKDLKDIIIHAGYYPFLDNKFLYNCSLLDIQVLDGEYSMEEIMNIQLSKDIFVIHSFWSGFYKQYLKVIKSNIKAGEVGVMYRKNDVLIEKSLINTNES